MTTQPGETDVQVTFTVRVNTYGHADKVHDIVRRDLERIVQLAFRDRATVDVADDHLVASLSWGGRSHALDAIAALKACACPRCPHGRTALELLGQVRW